MFGDKKLGFGLARLPHLEAGDGACKEADGVAGEGTASAAADGTDIDMDQLKAMVDTFLGAGFGYFDTAWFYENGQSEHAAKEALVDRHARESFMLADKLHHGTFDTPEGRDEALKAQLAKTGVDFFDCYLIHGVESASLRKYEEFDCFDWLLEKKAQGLVKHVGFSFHDGADLLDAVLTAHPEMEFVQLQINYLDWESEWIQARANYEVCVRHGKPVIVMEPVKGGTLAVLPDEAAALLRALDPQASAPSWAIRFAASLPGVALVLSGMSSLAQVKDNISYMEDFTPLTQAEIDTCFKVADIVNARIAIPCTACNYCVPGCPMDIPIPQYFSLFNEVAREDMEHKGWTSSFGTYKRLAAARAKASECIECGQCEAACTQHLPVVDDLKQVADVFER